MITDFSTTIQRIESRQTRSDFVVVRFENFRSLLSNYIFTSRSWMRLGWPFACVYIYILTSATRTKIFIYVCLRRHTLCNEGKLNGGIKSGGGGANTRRARFHFRVSTVQGGGAGGWLGMKIWKRYCAPLDRFEDRASTFHRRKFVRGVLGLTAVMAGNNAGNNALVRHRFFRGLFFRTDDWINNWDQ